jgi:hypothetical protein
MWYASVMKLRHTQSEMIEEAERAIENARAVREFHAKRNKRGTRQRETDIRLALERLRDAMKPIRRAIARLPYDSVGMDAETLKTASQDIQRERRKLWKMKGSKRKRKN